MFFHLKKVLVDSTDSYSKSARTSFASLISPAGKQSFSILTLSYLRLDGFHGDLLVSHLLSLLELLLLLLSSPLLASQLAPSSVWKLCSFLESCFSIVSSLHLELRLALSIPETFRLSPSSFSPSWSLSLGPSALLLTQNKHSPYCTLQSRVGKHICLNLL